MMRLHMASWLVAFFARRGGDARVTVNPKGTGMRRVVEGSPAGRGTE